ncbi:MAG: DUF4124 domain-containing protein [Burkholderiaceae bacterium]
MKRHFFALLLTAVAAAGHAHAQNDVFLCVDQNGTKEYKNTGATKGCKKVELPPLTIAAPVKRPPVQAAAARPAVPSDFPTVDGATQKARDNDRRQILLDEMKREEQKLAELKKEYNDGEPERQGNERNYAKYQERVASMKSDIERSEKNVEALKRELGNLK